MSAETLFKVVIILNVVTLIAIFLIEIIYLGQKLKKIINFVDNLTIRFNDYCVQNEHDKLDIYKRLADLEEERENNG